MFHCLRRYTIRSISAYILALSFLNNICGYKSVHVGGSGKTGGVYGISGVNIPEPKKNSHSANACDFISDFFQGCSSSHETKAFI
jgi:hypothetical protein